MVVKNGAVLPTPFLDISDLVSTGSEQGLLGLAFHPSYKTNGFFYVNFTRLDGAHRHPALHGRHQGTRTSRIARAPGRS